MGFISAGSAVGYAPYCGAPPVPAALAQRWNLDPVLLVALLAAALAYAVYTRAWTDRGHPSRAAFYTGWAVATLSLISPLCALSVSLFSARVGQHMVLAAVAAPLIALGMPRLRLLGGGALLATAAFGAILWFWHAPVLYRATFDGPVIYWLMHLTLFGSAVWLWAEILAARHGRLGHAFTALSATGLQMGVLGAVLTFAPKAIYAVHAVTAPAWGVTALQDQQLGGVIMWVPAGLIIVTGLVLTLASAMGRTGSRAVLGAAA
jgi:putative membrane protein